MTIRQSGQSRAPGFVVALLTAAIVCIFAMGASAARSPSTTTAKIRVALVLPDFAQNAAILDVKKGADAAARKIGNIDLITTGSISADGQVRAIEDAIAAKVDVI